jgi:hypothetical protein
LLFAAIAGAIDRDVDLLGRRTVDRGADVQLEKPIGN